MLTDIEVANLVTKTIQGVIGTSPTILHEPKFVGNEWNYLKECLDTGFVSSVGKFVDRFEYELASYTNSKYAIAVVNGTAALHIALSLSGVKPGDEVLIPSLSFVATANAVTYCGAIPHFVESETVHLGIDAHKIREYLKSIAEIKSGQLVNRLSGRVIRAVVPMHTFGHPVQLEELLKLAHDFNLVLVEDAAESLGSFYHGKHTGTFGLFGTLSFNGNKTITTGGGGAILTQDEALAKHAKHITTTAKIPHSWDYVHDEIGYNYRMPNINAALGCAQLESLPSFLESKRILFHKYKDAFQSIDSVSIMEEPKNCKSNYWLQTLRLGDELKTARDSLLKNTNDNGVMTRPCWRLLHTLEPFKNSPKMEMNVAESLEQTLINIPSSSFLSSLIV
ncbi:LegC family aminotransferase [Leptospira biflexa]|uniref:LegC family aminotransferase n=1 Tax=Leptospira biflexa TaxID=172 RepID=UPI0010917133|nr:LegC family aminotransferase [Leptospira biflexa]TGM44546.1 LegC family aminotransferase [Leptospira biflexa]TGM45413.1 LegC family aminotransferase [Leptospira biflexa]